MTDNEYLEGVDCPKCGTEFEVDASGLDRQKLARGELEMLFVDRCPNPDCPGKESNMAKATDPQP